MPTDFTNSLYINKGVIFICPDFDVPIFLPQSTRLSLLSNSYSQVLHFALVVSLSRW